MPPNPEPGAASPGMWDVFPSWKLSPTPPWRNANRPKSRGGAGVAPPNPEPGAASPGMWDVFPSWKLSPTPPWRNVNRPKSRGGAGVAPPTVGVEAKSCASVSRHVVQEICTEYGTCAFEEFAFCAQHAHLFLHTGNDGNLFVHSSLEFHSSTLCKRLVCGLAGQAQVDRTHYVCPRPRVPGKPIMRRPPRSMTVIYF